MVDLSARSIAIGDTGLTFEESTNEIVLQRYVSLLYLLRQSPVGTKLPLRDADLDTLGSTLGERRQKLVDDLHTIMGDRRTINRTRAIGRQRRVLQAGLLVGATVAGALVMVGEVLAHDDVVLELPSRRGTHIAAVIPIDFETALPGWTISYQGDHPVYGGLTHRSTRTITIHVDPMWSDAELAHVLMHEIGHAIDLEYLNDSDRAKWLEMRSMTSAEWWAREGAEDFSVGSGDFAEAMAQVALSKADPRLGWGAESNILKSMTHVEFSADQLEFVDNILSNATRNIGAIST